MNYYIADTHFGHTNILRICNRPFATIQEMDEAIIENWNNKVKPDDDVYILGDFCFKTQSPLKYLRRLNGHKHLVIGNHDKEILKSAETCKEFVEIKDIITTWDNGYKIVLCHYPMVEWDGYFYNTLHFYGHVHNNYKNMTTCFARDNRNAYNVGVDVLGFEPHSLREIIGEK